MATITELTVGEELVPLQEVAVARRWLLELVSSTVFRLTLPAKDGTDIQLEVDCDGYPEKPPAWHFRNSETGDIDQNPDTPVGGSFLHSHGVICAPWNRLAYVAEDKRGPHSDWAIGNWRDNPKTQGTKTLLAMALRVAVELLGSYEKRRA